MIGIDGSTRRLDGDFRRMPIAVEEQRAVLERAYDDRQERFEKSFMPALKQVRVIWEPGRDGSHGPDR